jgi:hypothetical protein
LDRASFASDDVWRHAQLVGDVPAGVSDQHRGMRAGRQQALFDADHGEPAVA